MAGKVKDRTGEVYNSWTIVALRGVKKGVSMWEYRCKCGYTHVGTVNNIINGSSKQCVYCQSVTNTKCSYEEELPIALWNKIVKQAGKREIEFSILRGETYKLFLQQDKKCILSGMNIAFAKNPKDYRRFGHTASLDRIDSKKGYIKGNVQWVHKYVNLMKYTLEQDEFIRICKLIANNNKNENLV